MNISTLLKTVTSIPPNISILMRGATGIGKSAIARQIAESCNLPLIDVRGSTMSEGDVGGYPDIEGMKKKNIMTFCMPSWFVKACNEPVVLFLDELNRSLPPVQQAFFQLVLDRQLGNDENGIAYSLHPQTRVFSAINHGSEYDVNEIDPALLRRFWTVDVETSVDDWISWAIKNKINFYITEFLRTKSVHFAPDITKINPGKVFPTPASWTRFDQTLKFCNFNIDDKSQDTKFMLYNIAEGFIGTEAAIDFSDFVQKYNNNVTPEDVLNSFDRFKDKISNMSNDRINDLIERIGEYSKTNNINLSQGENLAKFGKMISEEMLIHLWSEVSKNKNIESIKSFHKFIGDYIVEIVKNNKELIK